MKTRAHRVAIVAGLVLLLAVTSSFAGTPDAPTCSAPGCNPTTSDEFDNTAGGTDALVNVQGPDGGQNAAFGSRALNLNTSGFGNTALGADTLAVNTSGSGNIAIGVGTLGTNTIGFANTAVGYAVLPVNTIGSANMAIGGNALFANTTGNENTATGFRALLRNQTGNFNTASGSDSMFSNGAGSSNTAAGRLSLVNNVDGNNNTAVGSNALFNSTGSKNIGIGYQAGSALVSGSNNIYIGSVSGADVESQTIRIGKAQTQTFMAGIGNASVSGATVEGDTSTGQLGIVTSSARYKEDIAPMGSRSEKMRELRPVTFAYKDDARKVMHYGLVAEEVAAVYPDLVTRTASGEVQTVKYQELIPMLLNELQRQQQEITMLKRELAELRCYGSNWPSWEPSRDWGRQAPLRLAGLRDEGVRRGARKEQP